MSKTPYTNTQQLGLTKTILQTVRQTHTNPYTVLSNPSYSSDILLDDDNNEEGESEARNLTKATQTKSKQGGTQFPKTFNPPTPTIPQKPCSQPSI